MSPLSSRRTLLSSVALACVAVVMLAACTGSDDKGATSTVPSTDAKGKPVSLSLALGRLGVQAVGPAKPFDPATAKEILKLVNDYIANGVAGPLFTGTAPKRIDRYFARSLAKRVGAKGSDRAALTDEHAPVITSVSKASKEPLVLVGLQSQGRLVMIGARFGLSVKGTTEQGPLAVSRLGHFVFEPDAKREWHITGYTLVVHRDTGATSTTKKATTTTAES